MIQISKYENHQKALGQATKAADWLMRSLAKAVKIDISKPLMEEKLAIFENLTSRFARLCDTLIQKVFRSLNLLELDAGGSMIEMINRAAKRGLVKDRKRMRDLKEVRNIIAHEYTEEEPIKLFKLIHDSTSSLLEIYENAKNTSLLKR